MMIHVPQESTLSEAFQLQVHEKYKVSPNASIEIHNSVLMD